MPYAYLCSVDEDASSTASMLDGLDDEYPWDSSPEVDRHSFEISVNSPSLESEPFLSPSPGQNQVSTDFGDQDFVRRPLPVSPESFIPDRRPDWEIFRSSPSAIFLERPWSPSTVSCEGTCSPDSTSRFCHASAPVSSRSSSPAVGYIAPSPPKESRSPLAHLGSPRIVTVEPAKADPITARPPPSRGSSPARRMPDGP
jgi:hypothetical protein